MRKDLALVPVFLVEVALAASMGLSMEPIVPMTVLPFLVTVAYAAWCESYTLAFICGFVSAWAFFTAVFLWYFLQGGYITHLPPEGFAVFSVLGLAYGLLGLLATKIARTVKQEGKKELEKYSSFD